ncbi:lyase family protein [Vibrio pelagius]|uniref:lyase family protein n=1 Tax=Vibrio pelagius TaxID=28169 RepID=UPI0021C2F02B|nr:lyase family protein [Vibrio pelagius]
MQYRIEVDNIGEVKIPALLPYGAQTQRALNLYPIGNQKTLGDYASLIKAVLRIKLASARVNREVGEMDPVLSLNVENTCQSILENYQRELFPVHAFHGGGGISVNMNVNEVVANIVNHSYYAQPYGTYSPAHPNDTINMNHSTSDCLQTASHLAIIEALDCLNTTIERLIYALEYLMANHGDHSKLARTCMQDAVTIEFKQFWSGYLASLKTYKEHLNECRHELLAVNLSGNIIGRKGDCSVAYAERCISVLANVTDLEIRKNDNLFQSSQSFDAQIRCVSEVENLAGFIIKIAKDLRLMSSGPEGGLSEITLPAVQAGSSAMPGKVNPTIPEFAIQSAMQAQGHCYSSKQVHVHGELDYNPWGMLLTTNLLDAIDHLEKGISVLTEKCIFGIEVNLETESRNKLALVPLVVHAKSKIGYKATLECVNEANNSTELKETLQKMLSQ